MLRIFLYSAIIIGCFANFARNDWGFQLRAIAELILGITFLVEFISAILKKDLQKTKGDRILMQIESFCIAIFFLAFPLRVLHWPGTGAMYVLSVGIFVIVLVIRMLNLFLKEDYSKNQKSIFLVCYLIAITCSTVFIFNSISQDPIIFFVFLALTFSFICCSVILLLLVRLSILLLNFNKISSQKLISDLFFSTTIILCLGILFKTMHWPGGSFVITVGFIGFFLSLILGLIIKTSSKEKINLLQYSRKQYRISHFVFFYFGIWSIYGVLAQNQLAPRFYSSENPYVYEKLLEEGNRDKAEMIRENYSLLIEEIEKKEAEQSTNQD